MENKTDLAVCLTSLDMCLLYKSCLIPFAGKRPDQSAVTGVEESVPEPSVPSPPTTGYVMAQKLLSKDQTQGKSHCPLLTDLLLIKKVILDVVMIYYFDLREVKFLQIFMVLLKKTLSMYHTCTYFILGDCAIIYSIV